MNTCSSNEQENESRSQVTRRSIGNKGLERIVIIAGKRLKIEELEEEEKKKTKRERKVLVRTRRSNIEVVKNRYLRMCVLGSA